MPRIHRVDPNRPGLTRRRHGRGFTYRDTRGRPLTDEETLERIRGLAIPPAWQDVWICPDPLGHIQATGVDAAGRRQYPYQGGPHLPTRKGRPPRSGPFTSVCADGPVSA